MKADKNKVKQAGQAHGLDVKFEEDNKLVHNMRLKKRQVTVQPEAEKPDSGSKLLAEKLDSMSRENVMILQELKDEISKIKLESAMPPVKWIFDIERDNNGYLKRITAHADREKVTLN